MFFACYIGLGTNFTGRFLGRCTILSKKVLSRCHHYNNGNCYSVEPGYYLPKGYRESCSTESVRDLREQV